MKLEQGQVYRVGADYLRIVKWARLSIEYKRFMDWETKEGEVATVSKKEFCRLIRHGELLSASDQPQCDEEL